MTDVSSTHPADSALDHGSVEGVRLYYRCCRLLCRLSMILLVKARAFGVHNVPAKGGALLVCNHQSFFDPLLAGIPLPREAHFMARDSLFHNRFFGGLISSVNAFPVRRNSADLGAIKEAMRRLKQGHILILFPEGTRSPDGKIGVMFSGLAAIAKKVCVPVIPTIIDGMYQAWPRGRKLPGVGDVVVEYDQPIMPAEYADLTADQLMDLVRGRLVTMQERWHSRVPWRRLK